MKRLDGNNFIFDPKQCLKVCSKHFKINQYNSVAELPQADKGGLLQALWRAQVRKFKTFTTYFFRN
jgi:hypothetical protein